MHQKFPGGRSTDVRYASTRGPLLEPGGSSVTPTSPSATRSASAPSPCGVGAGGGGAGKSADQVFGPTSPSTRSGRPNASTWCAWKSLIVDLSAPSNFLVSTA